MFTDDNSHSTELVISTQPLSLNTSKSAKKLNLPRSSHKSVIDAFNESIGELDYTETQSDEKKDTIHDDIRSYRKYVTEFNSAHKTDATSSALFWQTYANGFPNLAKLARNYLSTPATSVPSETCFSMSSFLARKERARITGDNLASSVFLKDKINH
ncbi:unnamed protein product [Rotaria sp. Silwood2]|nr:unnamed protein product [Rotaria sp. Silwood2]